MTQAFCLWIPQAAAMHEVSPIFPPSSTPRPSLTPATQPDKSRAIALVLCCVCLALYWPLRNAGFLCLDDDLYLYSNPVVPGGLTWDGIRWALTAELTFTTPYADYWVPAATLSHMCVSTLFGMNPAGHHLLNVLLHAASVCLLFLFLARTTGRTWPAAGASLLFAIHPMNVESVAWVTERKDVLCVFFSLLALHAYARYARRHTFVSYLLVTGLFAAALLSKPMAVALPVVFLLLDWWPLKRVPTPGPGALRKLGRVGLHLVVEKLPWFLMSLVIGLLAVRAAHAADAVPESVTADASLGVSSALAGYLWYMKSAVWPSELGVVIPRSTEMTLWKPLVGFLLLAVSLGSVYLLPRRRWLALGVLWFVGTLLPVSGLISVGPQETACRFGYFPYIGLFICAAWLLAEHWPPSQKGSFCMATACVVLLAGLAVQCRAQVGRWTNQEKLWQYTVRTTAYNPVVIANYAGLLGTNGKRAEAEVMYRDLLRHDLCCSVAWAGLGTIKLVDKDTTAAVRALRTAYQLEPQHPQIQRLLASAFYQAGHWSAAKRLLGIVLTESPRDPLALWISGEILLREGHPQSAQRTFGLLIEQQPDSVAACSGLARSLWHQGKTREACDLYLAAVDRLPHDDSATLACELAWLSACDPGSRPISLTKALELVGTACASAPVAMPQPLDTLALVQAAAGTFPAAADTARMALKAWESTDRDPAYRAALELRLASYEHGTFPTYTPTPWLQIQAAPPPGKTATSGPSLALPLESH